MKSRRSPKTKRVTLSVSRADYELLKEVAEDFEMPLSAFLEHWCRVYTRAERNRDLSFKLCFGLLCDEIDGHGAQ